MEFSHWHEAYKSWLFDAFTSKSTVELVYNSSIGLLSIILAVTLFMLCRHLLFVVTNIINKRGHELALSLRRNKFFVYLSYYIPLLVLRYSLSILFPRVPKALWFLEHIYKVLAVCLFILVVNSILNTLVDRHQYKNNNRSKPIKGLVQFLQIIIYFFGIIICISIMWDKSLPTLIAGLGAASAVLMLIFKDSIMGLVSGVQLSFNNMVQIGDSISLPKYNVDGEVIDITLTSVKVRNWDKSVSTIPSYSLVVQDSLRNWRPMKEGGVRRIMRSINIDMNSVNFCTPENLEQYKKIAGVEKIMERHAAKNSTSPFENLTNAGLFRAYVYTHLRQRNDIHQDEDIMVRQLQPTLNGLPIEIYCFTNTSNWSLFENIQADIFDHIIAMLPLFDLKVLQVPTLPPATT